MSPAWVVVVQPGMSATDARVCNNVELERIPALQLVLLLFGHPPHQGFIISGPETFGTEQHHITTNAALNSDKVLDDHLGVLKITDTGRNVAH